MRTLDGLIKHGVQGRRILVRSDLNVPLSKNGKRAVTDDGRIRASLPTLTKLLDHGARVIVTAHLGRPAGAPDPAYSLGPVADRLAQLLGRPVEFALDTVGVSARLLADGLQDGEVLLLENVRFNAGETSKDDAERLAFGRCLALLTGGEDDGGAFVEDAFGAVHRKHASVYDVATLLPHYCGDLVRDELQVLRELTGEPKRPYVVVLGGSKVSDKLAVIESLLPKVDKLLVGGGMCFTFLAAQGHEVGDSLLEADQIDTCRELLAAKSDDGTAKIVLPSDIVVAAEVSDDASTETVAADAIPAGMKGLDIGPDTVHAFAAELGHARRSSGTARWASSRSPSSPPGRRESPRRSRPSTGCPSSVAATQPRPCGPWAWTSTRSATSRPAAARRWSSSRARRCPASPSWKRSE